jgi:hypothetical protein
MQTDLPLG